MTCDWPFGLCPLLAQCKTVKVIRGNLTLRHLASVQGRSQAEIIREAIESYTSSSLGRPGAKGIGQHDSGRTDVSTRAKELVRRAARGRRWR